MIQKKYILLAIPSAIALLIGAAIGLCLLQVELRHSQVEKALDGLTSSNGPAVPKVISTDRIDCTNGEWFVAASRDISHTGAFIDDIAGNIAYGEDSFGNRYFSSFHFCGWIRLDSAHQGSYTSVADFLAKNPKHDWELLE